MIGSRKCAGVAERGFPRCRDTLARVAAQSHPEAAVEDDVEGLFRPGILRSSRAGCPLPGTCTRIERVGQKMRRGSFPSSCRTTRIECFLYAGPANRGQRARFFAIFSPWPRAIEIARMLPEPAMREKVSSAAKDFLLSSF